MNKPTLMKEIYMVSLVKMLWKSTLSLTAFLNNFKSSLQKKQLINFEKARLKPLAIFVIFCAFTVTHAAAQNSAQYIFSNVANASLASDKNGNTVTMASGTTQLIAASQDDQVSANTAIGFNFWFMGTSYSQFTASSNGLISLGTGTLASNIYGQAFPLSAQPVIAPYWGDLATSAIGKVHYKLVGTYPNRTLVIEFLNMSINWSGGADGTYQLRLYEQTNVIEYVYGAMSVGGTTTTTSRTVAIGFCNNNTGSNYQFSVDQATYATNNGTGPITSTNAATGTLTGLNSTANGSRKAFTFTPSLSYKSQFISMNTGGTTWCSGTPRTAVTVTVKNIGTATWSNSGNGMNIGLKWNEDADYGAGPTFIPRVSVESGSIAGPVIPGRTVTYTFANVPASTVPGANNLTFDVVKELDCWLGNNNGSCGPGNAAYTSPVQTTNSTPAFTTQPSTAGQTVCLNSTTATPLTVAASGTGTTYQWYGNATASTTGGTLVTGATGASYTPSSAVAGTLYYYCIAANSCSTGIKSNLSGAINVNPKPVANAITGANSLCTATTITLTSAATGTAPLTYTWASSTAAATANSSGLITGVSSGTPNITYTVTDGNGCAATSANFAVAVSTSPTANTITAAAAKVCVGSTLALTAHGSAGTVTWTSSNTAFATVSTTGVVTGVAPGVVNVTYTVTGTNTCTTTSANYAVTVNANPVANTITGGPGVCTSGTVTLVSNATGAAALSYVWVSSATGIATVGAGTGVVTGKAPGTANLSYTVKDGNGCTAISAPYLITDADKPTANAITQAWGINILCASGTLNLTSNATPAGSYTYTWSSSNTAVAIVSNTGVVTGVAAGTANITYTATNNGACTSASSPAFGITVNPIPSGSLSSTENSGTPNDNIICAGTTVTFTATPGFGAYTFKVNGVVAQAASITNTFSSTTLADNDVVTVDVDNSSNCGTTFNGITIHVNPLPAATLVANSSTTICPGDNVSFTAGGGNNYIFKINGTSYQNSSSTSFTNNTFNNGDTVTVDVTNFNGCVASSSKITINVNAAPTGTLTPSSTLICAGDNVSFTATGGFSSYTFKVNGTTVKGPGVSNTYSSSTLTNGQVVSVTAQNATNCSATFTPVVITVNSLPSGTLSAAENSGIPNDNSICTGTNVNFTATAGFSNYNFKVNGASQQNGSSNTFSSITLANNDSVTVDVTGGTNCSATFNYIKIIVVASPAGSLTASPAAICLHDNIIFTATAGFANYAFKVNGTVAQTGSSNTYSTTSIVNGDVISADVTNSNSCVLTFNSITQTVNPLPTGTLVPVENSGNTANDGIICTGTSVTFTAPAGFTSYNFLFNGASVQNSASATYVKTGLATNDSVQVIVSNSNNCVAFLNTVKITVNAYPAVPANINGTLNVCANKTTMLTDATTGGVWSSSNTAVATVSAGVVTGVSAGVVTISYTVTNANGCSAAKTASVTVNALPVLAAIGGTPDVCKGFTTQLTNSTPGGTWTSGTISVATISGSGLVTGVAAGTSTITYTFTNSNGCKSAVTAIVTVNALPTVAAITVTSPATFNVCVNSTLALNDATPGGVWSSGNTGLATISSTGVVTGIANGTVTISYQVTNGNGCVTAVTKSVAVHSLPAPTLIGLNPFCPNATVTYFTEPGQASYVWSVTGGTVTAGGTSVSSSVTVKWGTTIPRSIYINYSNSFGCTSPVPATLTTNSGVVPTISGPATTCFNSSNNYLTQSGKAGYTWNAIGGTITAGATTNNPTINWTTVGTDSVSINFADASGCTAAVPTIMAVTVNPLPAATMTGGDTVCAGSTLPVITFTGSGGTIPYTFTYTINGGSNQTVTTASGSTVTLGAPTGSLGIFIYTLVSVADNKSCSQAQSGNAIVQVNPLPTGSVSGGAGVCQNSVSPNVTFTGTAGTGPFTFSYNINGGATQTVTTTSGNTVTVAATTGTAGAFVYNLLSVADDNGCSQTQSGNITITVNATPTALISGTVSACKGSTAPLITFTGANGIAPYIFTYNINGGSNLIAVSSGATATVSVSTATAGVYNYNLVAVQDASSALCSQTQTGTATVTVNPPTVAGSLSAGAIVCSGSNSGSINLTGNTGTVTRWELSADGGITWSSVANTTTTIAYTNITQTTQYRAVVQSGACSGATTAPVTVTTNPVSVGGTVNTSATVCSNINSGTLTLSGYTGSIVRWESSVTAGVWVTIANTTATQAYSNLTQTTSYRAVVQSGVCALVNSVAATITVNALPAASISGTTSLCLNTPSPAITFTGAAGTAPYIFTYNINGGLNQTVTTTSGNAVTVAAPANAAGIFNYNLVSVKDASSTTCLQSQSGTAVITINTLPAPVVITPAPDTICIGSTQILNAGLAAGPNSASFSSGPVSITIPDNTPAGAASTIAVSGIPAGATITGVSVNFNITGTNNADQVINLKAPNNSVLNLVNSKGGTGSNFTNTTVSSAGSAAFTISPAAAPFNGIFKADAVNGVGATGYTSTITAFSSLYSTPNGNWIFIAKDGTAANTSAINNWSITINYTTAAGAQSVIWSPVTSLYTDAAATIAYASQSVSTVYSKPSATGSVAYTATSANGAGCTAASAASVLVNGLPAVSITADYCLVPNKVHLNAVATPGVTYLWSNGATTQSVDIDVSGYFQVTVKNASGCTANAAIDVATDLVVNGDFSAGNTGFTSDYTYYPDVAGNNELVNDAGTNGYGVGTDGQNYHPGFWGKDHTNGPGTRNFMLINGHGTLVIWKETISVLPNTTYYYSAWGMGLNSGTPVARLQFNVQGQQVGTIDTLNVGVNSNANNGWTRFYGNWTSGPTTTTINISITDLETSAGYNDFGIDDVSFGTLSTFVTLESGAGTNAQVLCVNTPLTPITYNVGNGSSTGPAVTGLPPGVTSVFSGDEVTFSGSPTAAGAYTYTITTTGCNPTTISGTITVQAPAIALSSGSSLPTVCVGSGVSIGYILGGTATGATITGLPAGVTYAVSGAGFTISGTPTAAGIYPYTITTTGTCTQTTATGTITVQSQNMTLSSAAATTNQTLCTGTTIVPVQYAVTGTGTGATVSGLPAGVTGTFSGGVFAVTGTPSQSGTFSYTITSTGSCTVITATDTLIITPAAAIALTSGAGTNSQSVCNNSTITPITYTITNATGAAITAGSLPSGVSGSFSGGVFNISGTPNVTGTFNYTVTTSGGCATANLSGTITSQIQSITLTSGTVSPALCINTAMTNIVYTISGSGTGASATGLPSGVTGTVSGNVFTIKGTPTLAGSYPYTITTSGTCAAVTASGTITVQPAAVGGTVASSANVCSGANGTLILTGQSGTIVRWETSVNNGSSWVAAANATITLSYTNLQLTTMYRAVINNGCGDVFSSVATIGVHNLWAGAINSNWNLPGNWADGLVPSLSCPNVYIPAGTPNSPVLSSGTATINNLYIYPGAILTVTGATLQIAGTLNNTGVFDVNTGTVEFNGSSAQTIAGGMFAGNAIMNFKVSNSSGIIVSNAAGNLLNITGALSFGNVNNATLNTGDNIVLKSTATGTAMVADITNNGANTGNVFTGKVTVERYYPARRAWRLVTAPLSGAGTVYSTWQNSGVFAGGRGTYITGPGAAPVTNGMDVSPQSNTSLKAGSNLTAVGNTLTTVLSNSTGNSDNKGFFLFVRGDRVASNFNLSFSNTTTLSSIGKLQTGAQTFTATPAATAFTLVGNPYASPVDFKSLTRTNLVNRFYVWDPYLNTQQGGYVMVDDILNTGTYTLSPSISPGGQTRIIQSSQAFFVQTLAAGAASISFKEPAKSAANNLGIYRPMGDQVQGLSANLYLLNDDSTTVLADGNITQFGDMFNKEVDVQDALKFTNVNETLGLISGSSFLSADRRPALTANDTIFFKFTRCSQRKYQFRFTPSNLNPTLLPLLEDKYTGTPTPLSISSTSTVNFSVDANAASKDPARFRIVFIAPLAYTSVQANMQSRDIAVEWKVENELRVKGYEVQKSVDSATFIKVSTAAAMAGADGKAMYNWLDAGAVAGDNFYRIKNLNLDGTTAYSKVVKVNIPADAESISVYPNPVVDGTIGLQLRYLPQGQYHARLINNLGQVLLLKEFTHPGGTALQTIKVAGKLNTGVYKLEVTRPDKITSVINVLVK